MSRRVILTALWCALTLFAAPVARAAPPNIVVHFSPWDDAEGAILDVLKQARQQVLVQAYLLTSKVIADALLAAHARGIEVKVLADQEMVLKGNDKQLQRLHAGGVAVWLETRYGAAHNKLILIDVGSDNPVVLTGSYNFTWSAQARNAENLLVISGDRGLAQRYAGNWQRHRNEAVDYRGHAVPPAPSLQ